MDLKRHKHHEEYTLYENSLKHLKTTTYSKFLKTMIYETSMLMYCLLETTILAKIGVDTNESEPSKDRPACLITYSPGPSRIFRALAGVIARPFQPGGKDLDRLSAAAT